MNIDIKISQRNLLDWSHMEDWVDGASSAPTNHTLTGAGASVARESTIVKFGTYSAKVTRAGADTTLYYDHPDYTDYQGRKVTFGCWVYATVASRARIAVNDGVGSSNSSYHSGGSGWEFLSVTHDIDSAATQMRVEMQVNSGDTSGYFDGGVLCLGDQSIVIITDYADIGRWRTTNRYRSQRYDVPRREGIRVPNFRIQSKSLDASGMVVGTTPTAKRTAFDTLMKAVNSYITKPNGDIDEKDLYFYDDRCYRCFVESADPDEKAAATIADLRLRFVIPQPFLWAVNKTKTRQALSGTTTFTVTNGGSAPTHPIITVTNDSSNITSLTIENLTTGQKFNYSGTLQTSQDLVLDAENLTVENNGTGDLGNVTNEVGIILVPGDNEFQITGVVAGSIDVDAFDRWY